MTHSSSPVRALARFGLGVAALVFAMMLGSPSAFAASTYFDQTPAPGSISANTRPLISVKVSDPAGISTGFQIKVDGVTRTPKVTWGPGNSYCMLSYQQSTALANGNHTVYASVFTGAGRTSTTWTFTTRVAPVLGPLSPADNSVTNQQKPEISAGVVSGAAISSVEMTVDGQPVAASYNATTKKVTYTPTTNLSNDAQHAVTLKVTDSAGTSTSVAWRFTVQIYADMSDTAGCTDCHTGYPVTHPMDDCMACHEPFGPFSAYWNMDDLTPVHGADYLDGINCTYCHSSAFPNIPKHVADVKAAHVTSDDMSACPCHVRNLTIEHNRYTNDLGEALTCLSCHTSTDPMVQTGLSSGSTSCMSCHAISTDHPYADVDHIADVGEVADLSGVACGTCHDMDLMAEHEKTTSTSAGKECGNCHPTPRSTFAGWNQSCSQGGCHEVGTATAMHGDASAKHVMPSPAPSCAQAGCHTGDVSALHLDAVGMVGGVERSSCTVCHNSLSAPTKDCGNCHTLDSGHEAVHNATRTDWCLPCHEGASLTTVHITDAGLTCATCHQSSDPEVTAAIAANDLTCSACHAGADASAVHPEMDAAHVRPAAPASDACFASGCHSGGESLAAVHEDASDGTLAGCDLCHGAGRTPTGTCTTSGCHANLNGHGDVTALHASNITSAWIPFFESGSGHANSESGAVSTNAECTMCHASTNLVPIHGNDCQVCHLDSSARDSFTTWTKGCQQGSCHPSYHDDASPGHDAEYDYGDCDYCHNDVGWGGWNGVATVPFCGGCHATGPDTVAPVTTTNALATYVGPASITFSPSDNRGAKDTFYRLDGGAVTKATGPLTVMSPATGSQSHTLEFWSTDWSGNVEAPHKNASFTITPDTIAPVTTSDAKAQYGGSVTIRFTATDNATSLKVKTTYYRIDDGPVQTGTVATMAEPAVTETHTIHFWSEDYAGNTEADKSATFTVVPDVIAPTVTSSLQPLPKYYGYPDLAGSTYLYAYFYPSDASPSSGIAGVRVTSTNPNVKFYNANEASWDPGISAWRITIWSFTTDANIPITFYARDKSGNVGAPVTTTISMDVTKPVTTSNAGTTYSGPATISLTPTDSWSGVATTYWKDGYYGAVQTGTTAVIQPPATGTVSHTLYFWSVDKAGNVEAAKTKAFSVTAVGVDVIAPTGSVSVSGGATWTRTAAVTLTLAATDTGGSGLSQMRFSNDNSTWSTWETYATSKAWTLATGDGAKTVYVQYRDTTGNVSATYSDGITLDATAPSTTSSAVNGQTYTGSQSFTLLPTDPGGSGISETWWQLDSTTGTWTSGTSAIVAAPSTGIASHTLYWYSRDAAGNIEATKSVAFSLSASSGSSTSAGTLSINDYTWVDADYGASGAWGRYSMYVNGILIGTKAADGNPTWNCPQVNLTPGSRIDIVTEVGFTNAAFVWDQRTPITFSMTLPANATRLEAATWSGFPNIGVGIDYWDDYGDDYAWVNMAPSTITNIMYTIEGLNDVVAPTGSITINGGAAQTNNANVTLALSATDTGGSTLAQMRFSNDNTSWSTWQAYATSKAWTLQAGDGTKTVYVQYRDVAGNVSTSYSDTITIDALGPVGTMSVNSGAVYANTTAATINSAMTDAGSSVTQMSVDPGSGAYGSWVAYSASYAITMPAGNGAKTVRVQYRDANGNITTKSDDITLDASAPVTTSSAINGQSYVGGQTFTLLPTDTGGSGIAGTWWQLDSTTGSWTSGTSAAVTAPSTGSATHTLYWYSRDNAGNQEVTNSVTFTLTQPLIQTTTLRMTDYVWVDADIAASGGWGQYSIYANGVLIGTKPANGTSTWNCPGVNVPAGARIDIVAEVGFTDPVYFWDEFNPVTYSITLPQSATRLEAATWSGFPNIEVAEGWWDDYGGPYMYVLIPPATISNITYAMAGSDTAAPTGSVTINNGAAYTNGTNVTLGLSASDSGGSGLSQMRFSNDGSSWSVWEAYSTSKIWTVTAGNGAKTVYVQYRDTAGNVSPSYSDGISVDGTAPSTSTNAVGGQNYTTEQTFTLTPSDTGGSGVAGTYYRLDGGAQQSGMSVTVPIPGNGTVSHTIEYWSVDAAGNTETHKTVTFSMTQPISTGTITLMWNASGGSWAEYYIYNPDGSLYSYANSNDIPGWNGWYTVTVPVNAQAYTWVSNWYDIDYDNEGTTQGAALVDSAGKAYSSWY